MSDFCNIEKLIDYNFNNKDLLKTAMTHQSYANEVGGESYERLEFLGDAIIELIVSSHIYDNYNFEVGVLTKLRSSLVSTDYLYEVSKELGLDKIALKSRSLSQLGKKNIADLFESMIGAIYIDGGLDTAKNIVYRFVIKSAENIKFVLKNSIDYKTILQEYMHSVPKKYEYRFISSSGLDHEKKHTIGLWVEDEKITEATATSKQIAEEKCAEFYIKNYTNFSGK